MSKADHFCFCSDSFLSEILDRQRKEPFDFEKLTGTHAGCKFGCGSCTNILREYLKENNLYFEKTKI